MDFDGKYSIDCPHCDGAGMIQQYNHRGEPDGGRECKICNGTGRLEPVVCPLCNGNGEYSVHSGGPDGDEYVCCDNCDGKGYIHN